MRIYGLSFTNDQLIRKTGWLTDGDGLELHLHSSAKKLRLAQFVPSKRYFCSKYLMSRKREENVKKIFQF